MSKQPQPSDTGEGRLLAGMAERVWTLLGSTGERMFERFTQRSRLVLQAAQEEARQLGHSYIGTEHLLLGLLRVREGIAAAVLENLGVELDEARRTVEALVGRGEGGADEGEMQVTPRTKKVFELAFEEARRLKHAYVGTEHLLLGLMREGEGIGFGALTRLGVTTEAVREQITELVKKDNVVTCRVSDQDAEAIDALVEAGICSSRSDAASWLIRAGIEANDPLFQQVKGTIAEIRRLRQEARATAQRLSRGG